MHDARGSSTVCRYPKASLERGLQALRGQDRQAALVLQQALVQVQAAQVATVVAAAAQAKPAPMAPAAEQPLPPGFQVALVLVTRRAVAYDMEGGNRLDYATEDDYEEAADCALHWCSLEGGHMGVGRREVDLAIHLLQVRDRAHGGCAHGHAHGGFGMWAIHELGQA